MGEEYKIHQIKLSTDSKKVKRLKPQASNKCSTQEIMLWNHLQTKMISIKFCLDYDKK